MPKWENRERKRIAEQSRIAKHGQSLKRILEMIRNKGAGNK